MIALKLHAQFRLRRWRGLSACLLGGYRIIRPPDSQHEVRKLKTRRTARSAGFLRPEDRDGEDDGAGE
jgi:hypothetical protein